jgi:hypothetical protein
MRKKSTNIMDQIVDMIISGEKSGVPAIDAQIADALEESRMALPSEKEELLRAKRNPAGSRMIKPSERASLEAREAMLKKMSKGSGKEVAKKVGKRAGTELLKKVAGVAVPVLGLGMEAADAAELGPAEGSRDALIESPDYTAEQKQKLLRALAAKQKARQPDFFKDLIQTEEKVQGMVDSVDPRSKEDIIREGMKKTQENMGESKILSPEEKQALRESILYSNNKPKL